MQPIHSSKEPEKRKTKHLDQKATVFSFCLLDQPLLGIKVFQGAYQNSTKFWQLQMAGDVQRHLTKGKLKESTFMPLSIFALGCHYSNLLQKNFCQWFTSKLHVQTLPRCCKTNSPHRCPLLQAVLLNRQTKKTEVKKTKPRSTSYGSASDMLLPFCPLVYPLKKAVKESSVKHRKRVFVCWNCMHVSGCKQVRRHCAHTHRSKTLCRKECNGLRAVLSTSLPNFKHKWKGYTTESWSPNHSVHKIVTLKLW